MISLRATLRAAGAAGLAAAMLAAVPAVGNAAPAISERRFAVGHAPAIAGTKLVWAVPNGKVVGDPNDPEELVNVKVRDLATGKTWTVSKAGYLADDLDVSGTKVLYRVWDAKAKRAVVRVYDVKTQKAKQLTKIGDSPRIDGSRIVYQHSSNGRIYVYDLKTGRALAVSKARGLAPDIAGNWVVWQQGAVPNFNVWAYNLKTKQLRQVTKDPHAQTMPRVDGNLVTWQDDRNGLANEDIYVGNLVTGTERRLVADAGNQHSPVLSGLWLVYRDDAADRLRAKNLKTKQVLELGGSLSGGAEISGKRVVYTDAQTGRLQVWLATIS